ncbi:carbohydrate kinase [Nocardioides guangzhouensis]|uniref:Carbohydrate kinase n=1 Tax=Nocardioides guangzhouensis TaxID=2497878 RepID=A0A4Q4ZJA7_9ACTN|nr:carbohydrate kinase family protein [Nocardioides guangzhouensis]RYP88363.1 carbohydrate kinase [Nocardioides guangzhouensis]
MTEAKALVVVVGGANVDVKARSSVRAVARTSNPGSARLSSGGVGRNIAENLARLGIATHLVSAVGNDPLGDQLVRSTAEAGVGVEHVARLDRPTGSYTAVLDADGELLVAVADMAAVDAIDESHVQAAGDLLSRADLVVLDGNLAPETMAAAARAAGDRPLVLDPVSVPKAERCRALLGGRQPWHLVTPDHLELAALTGLPTTYERQVATACARLHEQGVTWVWVREGERGSLLSGPDGATHLPAIPTRVVDVTGAGDAMLAAWCHGVLTGRSPLEAARLGHAAAALTIASDDTVRTDLTPALLEKTSGGFA